MSQRYNSTPLIPPPPLPRSPGQAPDWPAQAPGGNRHRQQRPACLKGFFPRAMQMGPSVTLWYPLCTMGRSTAYPLHYCRVHYDSG
ncbi:hypothetical protein V496_02635 [Pseudogymnoascus sp. VKM F-4515 (FW-2607)]|nr:hypothetical protein V496_02635 [Pseudogymnoascus sp. VKM F-4515 (FW-2607)]